MSEGDIVIFAGYILSSWSTGFAAGYILTKFKDALNQTV